MPQRDEAGRGGGLDAEQAAGARAFVGNVPWTFAGPCPSTRTGTRCAVAEPRAPDGASIGAPISSPVAATRARSGVRAGTIWTWGSASSTGSPRCSTGRAGSSTEPTTQQDGALRALATE
jgi:hypothetical protein